MTEVHKDGMAVLEKGEKLSKQACDKTNVGEMLFVMDSSEAFICDGESWKTLKGEDGEKGDPGKPGDAGTSCAAKSVKNKSKTRAGIEVTCGKTVVDTIWNGEKGDPGEPGAPGENGQKGENGKDGKDLIASPGTMGSFVDHRDGHVYKTIVIGTQTWMAENLNYSVNPGKRSWCGGGKSKRAIAPCTVAYGFSAIPAGFRGDEGKFFDTDDYACFWSATEDKFQNREKNNV